MVVARKASAIARCSTCRYDILSTFAAFAGLTLRPAPILRRSGLSAASLPYCRRLSTSPAISSGFIRQDVDQGDALAHHKSVEAPADNDHDPKPLDTAPAPWYLQVQGPQRVESPLSERQRLPELPVDPPPLLQPLLEHISIDLGLDDLSLFDLRKLDPPPALGANLIMIMGTARSEKHLHVSADRFCRWLRTAHKLSPYADGLLGRNELKLKMKRKAKRARLLSSVGSSEDGNADDGIRTGWVCVNVGVIEDAPVAAGDIERSDDFVGFGGLEEGVKLVIQMFTEEKREELDLEGLWGGTLARYQRKEAREIEKQTQEPLQLEEVGLMSTDNSHSANFSSPIVSSPRDLVQKPHRLSRSFHTSATRRKADSLDEGGYAYEGLDASSLEPRIDARDTSSLVVEDTIGMQNTNLGVSGDAISLRSLMLYLRRLPVQDGIDVLGRGVDDFESTSFLKSFFERLQRTSELEQQAYHLEMVSYALYIGHPGFAKKDLLKIFRNLQHSTLTLPESTYHVILTALFSPRNEPKEQSTVGQIEFKEVLSKSDILSALDIVEDLALRDGSNLPDYVSQFCIALSHPVASDDDEPSAIRLGAFWTLLHNLHWRHIHLNDDDHCHILQTFASSDDWTSYWRYWSGIARMMQPRSERLYELMFQHAARPTEQFECIKVLLHWLPEMKREEPPVPLSGGVARAVMGCLKVADPDIETQLLERSNEKGQWVRLWRFCFRNSHSTEDQG